MDLTGRAYAVTHAAESLVAALAGCGVAAHVYQSAAKLATDARTLADGVKAASTPAPAPAPKPQPPAAS